MNRRDFLRNIAIGGALGSIASRVSSAELVTSTDTIVADGSKLVFISDLHLNADPDASWMLDHIEDLADFLNSLRMRGDVSELVILGDMLDDWVRPTEDVPFDFEEILTATHNQPVVEVLHDICVEGRIKVTYVTGNHDLLSFEPENKEIIDSYFPNMIVTSNDPGLGTFQMDEVLWAEHGHRYTLFNAPDIWSHSGSHLPLGYFISRLVASKSITDDQIYTLPDIINSYFRAMPTALNPGGAIEKPYGLGPANEVGVREFLNLMEGFPAATSRRNSGRRRYPRDPWDEGLIDDDLIVLFFQVMALWAGKRPWDRFIMDNKDNFLSDPRVRTISQWYDVIFSKWPSRQNIVSNEMALWNELGYMDATANLLFAMPERLKPYYKFVPRIVLFGHTHKPLLQLHSGDQDTIYANTGTWIDNKPMTWVEIGIQDVESNKRSYEVALWYYGEKSARQSASIEV
jgi:UDP-2,3-diacylglucosamine pyrophosphatase LpxH